MPEELAGTSLDTPLGPSPEALVPAPSPSRVASRLLRGSGVYAVTNFGLKALNFLLIALYTRFLTPADYGAISLAEIIGAIVAAFCGLGLNAALQRMYFQYSDQPALLRSYLGTVLRSALALTLAVPVVAILAGPRLLGWIAPQYKVPFFPYIALAIGAAAANQLVDYRSVLYQVQERTRSFASLAFASFLLTAISVILLVVVVNWGAEGMLLGKLVGGVATAAIAIFLVREYLWSRHHWKFLKETLALGLPLVPHQLMALGLVVADRFILERYRSLTEVGLYSVAYTFGMVMYLVTASLSQAWSPIFYDLARQQGAAHRVLARIFSGMLVLVAAIAVFGSLIAQDFIHWFLDPRYEAVGRLIPWIIGGYLMHAIFSMLQLPVMQAKRSMFIWIVSLVALVANLALNFLWIPRWGMYGAAYATLAAYAAEAALMYVYAQAVFRLPYRRLEILAGLAVFVGALALTQAPWSPASRPFVMACGLLVGGSVMALFWGRELQQVVRTLWKP